MKEIKIFAALSAAAMLALSLLSGCTDHNSGYIDRPNNDTVTTADSGIVEWTTKAASATEARETKAKTTKAVATSKKGGKNSKTTKKKNSESNITTTTTAVFDGDDGTYVEYHFRSKKQLNEHFEKHGGEFGEDFGYDTAKDYEKGASDVINSSEALHKTEAEDGDGVYYIEATNEFVILSTDGYIRTYFRPNGGKSYYDRQ